MFSRDTNESDISNRFEGNNSFFSSPPGQLLQLTPAEEIVFRREDGETTGLLTMTNTSTCNVAYKVILDADAITVTSDHMLTVY